MSEAVISELQAYLFGSWFPQSWHHRYSEEWCRWHRSPGNSQLHSCIPLEYIYKRHMTDRVQRVKHSYVKQCRMNEVLSIIRDVIKVRNFSTYPHAWVVYTCYVPSRCSFALWFYVYCIYSLHRHNIHHHLSFQIYQPSHFNTIAWINSTCAYVYC